MAIIRRMKTRQKKGSSTSYNVTVEVENDNKNEVTTVDVYISTVEEQPEPNPQNVHCSYNKTEENIKYYLGAVEFETSAVGLTYPMTGTMKNNKGQQVGDQKEEEVEVQGAEELV